jgi:hypothetical protein
LVLRETILPSCEGSSSQAQLLQKLGGEGGAGVQSWTQSKMSKKLMMDPRGIKVRGAHGQLCNFEQPQLLLKTRFASVV